MTEAELLALAPAGILVAAALVALTLEAAGSPIGATKRGARTHLAWIGISAAAAAAFVVSLGWPPLDAGPPLFGGLAVDRIGAVASQAVLVLLALTLATSVPAFRAFDPRAALRRGAEPALAREGGGEERGDRYALLLLGGAGLLVVTMASDLLFFATGTVLFLVSLGGILVVDRRGPRGAESAVKLIHAGFAQLCILAFGLALLWGLTGEAELQTVVAAISGPRGWLQIGGLFAAAALLISLGAFPLHAARVDVLQGAPSFAAALLSSTSLITGAALLLRALSPAVNDGAAALLVTPLVVLGGACLILPAAAALDQRSVDRMFAHLSVGQAGVVLLPVALVAAGHTDRAGLTLICAAGGAFAVFGVAAAMGALERRPREELTWEQWSGLGRQRPIFALALLWLLGSLAGLPATAGFAARLGTARAAFEEGQLLLGWVAALAPLAAAVPVVRFGVFLFAKAPGTRCIEPDIDRWQVIVVGICALVVFALGVAPEPLWTRYLAELIGP